LVFSKSELKIKKCKRADGSIAYQERSCDTFIGYRKKHFTNNSKLSTKVSPKQKNHTKASKPYKQRSQTIAKYQKLSNTNIKDMSTQTISDRVKADHISLEVLKRWSMIKKVFNNKLLHMKFLDETPRSELSLLIDFTDPQGKKFNNSELINLSNLIGSRYAVGSHEGQVNTKLFAIHQGKGVLATFTNSDLVGDYQYATKGLIYKGKWLIQFTLLSNDLNSSGYQFALNSLSKSISIQ
jgi:hypothetical protein